MPFKTLSGREPQPIFPDAPVERPEPVAGESINQYVARLPRRRHSALAKGLLLEFPRTGTVGVPVEQHRGGWRVVVVAADRRGVNRPGGYDLDVSDGEIETAIERTLAI